MTRRSASTPWIPVRVRRNPQGKIQIGFDKHTTKPLFEAIQVGDRVSIVNRFGQIHTGRAVMLGPGGWVLNMGGRYGTPGIADETNTVIVKKGRASTRKSNGRGIGTRKANRSRNPFEAGLNRSWYNLGKRYGKAMNYTDMYAAWSAVSRRASKFPGTRDTQKESFYQGYMQGQHLHSVRHGY
jgi:hypothetical protein